MIPLSDFFTYVFVAIWALQLVWAGRIWTLGFARRYPVLLTYLVISSVLGAGMWALGATRPPTADSGSLVVYYWAWVATKPLYWTLLLCVLVEVHNNTLERFRGFHRLGQIFMGAALGLVGFLFVAMTVLGPVRASIRRFLETQQLAIFLALTVFATLLILFAVYFRLDVPANGRVVYGAFALSVATAAVFRALADLGILEGITSANATRINSLIYLGCLVAGCLLFSAAGEESRDASEIHNTVDVVGNDVSQGLENLNQQLVRILRS